MTGSPRENAATDAAQTQAALQAQLLKLGLPEISKIGTMIGGQLGGGYNEIMPQIRETFSGLESNLKQDYAQAGMGQSAAIRQRAKQSGMPFSTEQLSDAQSMAAIRLEQEKEQAMGRLKYAEAATNMGQFNQLMNMMGGASQSAIGMGAGMGQLWNQSIQGMNQSNPWGSVLSGVAGGAATGTAASPGWGTVIGAILGGVGGYFSGRQ